MQVSEEGKTFEDRANQHRTNINSGTGIAGPLFKARAEEGHHVNMAMEVFHEKGVMEATARAAEKLGGQWSVGKLAPLMVNVAEALTCAIFRCNVLFGGLNIVAGGHCFGRASYRIQQIFYTLLGKSIKVATVANKQFLDQLPASQAFASDPGILVSPQHRIIACRKKISRDGGLMNWSLPAGPTACVRPEHFGAAAIHDAAERSR